MNLSTPAPLSKGPGAIKPDNVTFFLMMFASACISARECLSIAKRFAIKDPEISQREILSARAWGAECRDYLSKARHYASLAAA